LLVATVLPTYLLISTFNVGYMNWYFKGVFILLIFAIVGLWLAKEKKHYLSIHNLLKFIIVGGVFGILLIDPELLLGRFI